MGDKNLLSFVICDDSQNSIIRLSKMLESIIIENNLNGQLVFTSQNPNELLHYTKINKVNVAILDIDLNNEMSGLKLAENIRKYDKEIYIIFITGHLEFGLVAYKYKTFDYIAKPVTTERFKETIIRLFDDVTNSNNKYIRLNHNKTIIPESSVKFIQKNGMKLIFSTDTRKYEVYDSFNKIEPILPKQFIRCHKSYIVNIDKISNIDTVSNVISFTNNEKCYIGPKYKNNLMEVFNNGIFTNNMDVINHT